MAAVQNLCMFLATSSKHVPRFLNWMFAAGANIQLCLHLQEVKCYIVLSVACKTLDKALHSCARHCSHHYMYLHSGIC